MIKENIKIQQVDEKNVDQAKNLIIKGLSEYFELYDHNKNPDLDDILKSYGNDKSIFFVAILKNKVIGTGAMVEEKNLGRIVRMYVDKEYRKTGVGSRILNSLEKIAKQRKYDRTFLETTKTWSAARNFYFAKGYTLEYEDEESSYFYKIISSGFIK